MTEDQNRAMQDKFMLRLPDGMRDVVKAAADANKRSMNAEIVHRLAKSIEADSYPKPEDFLGDDLADPQLARLYHLLAATIRKTIIEVHAVSPAPNE